MTGYRQDELFPDAATPRVADETSAQRRRRIILHTAVHVGDLAGIEDEDVTEDPAATALAVLAAYDHGWGAYLPRDHGDPLDIVNRYIAANNPGVVGTNGDYDMALIILVRIAIEYDRYLAPEARINLRDRLLSQRGPFNLRQLTWGVLGVLPVGLETENHVLMIEVSRYLSNSFFGGSTPSDGMADFLMGLMLDFLSNDFEEFNARPYQRFTVQAITLLADHIADGPSPGNAPAPVALDPAKVATAARMVLDYLSAKFAVSSNGLRRHVPFRRLNQNNPDSFFDNQADREQRRWLALTGYRRFYNEADPDLESLDFDAATVVQAVLSSYRPPLAMVNLMLVNEGKEYFQRFHHDGLEIFSSTPDFLISAGGIFVDAPYGHGPLGLFGEPDESHPLPTVLIPSEAGVRVSDVVHIDGSTAFLFVDGTVIHRDDPHKYGIGLLPNNTGVAPGFACGLNIELPDYLRRAGDTRVHYDLTLIDCTTLPSPEQHYLAVRRDPGSNDDSGKDGVQAGWIVAVPATALTFNEFESNILAGGGLNTVTASGLHTLNPIPVPSVTFTPGGSDDDGFQWPIRGADGEWIDASSWPLAVGDVMNSEDHNGVIHIDPPIFGLLKRASREPRSVGAELKRNGFKLPTTLRTALPRIAGVPSGAAISTRTTLFGVAAIQARHISVRMSLKTETAKRGISLSGGLLGGLRNVPGISLQTARSVRTSLSLLRRRLTLDGPNQRLIGPTYTTREAAVLHVADLRLGVRQLFGYQRGLAQIRLSDFVERLRLPEDLDQRRRYTVGEACRRINADPAKGLLRLFPAQVAQRTPAYRMSTILRPT